MDAEPLFAPLYAETIARHSDLPVTRPVSETVATPGLLLAHTVTTSVSTFPAASLAVALSCTVEPTVIWAAGGSTVTEATFGP